MLNAVVNYLRFFELLGDTFFVQAGVNETELRGRVEVALRRAEREQSKKQPLNTSILNIYTTSYMANYGVAFIP